MPFFGKKERRNILIKMYKVVDKGNVMDYFKKNFIDSLLLLASNCSKSEFSYIELNYGEIVANSRKKLETILAKKANNHIECLLATNENSSLYFSLMSLSSKRKPNKKTIKVTLAIEEHNFEYDDLSQVFVSFYELLKIEYGYGFVMSGKYDFENERKVKSNIFGEVVSVEQEDIDFNNNLPMIEEGFLRKLYNTNFLNTAQWNFLEKMNEKGVGEKSRINEHIYLLNLNNEEVNYLNNRL